ncbi:MAG: glycosyltransferase family 2 protein [Candidatus Korobacteraceae bacterium]
MCEPGRRPLLTVVTPAFNEAANLPVLWQRLSSSLSVTDINWEWVIVDDHSSDSTFETVEQFANSDGRVRGYRFSRNFGSHIALACGLERAAGDCAVVMSGDLQDPPELLPELIDRWRNGGQVIWAVRGERQGETATRVRTSNLFYFIMRTVAGLKELPPTGADFFLIDRLVIDALNQYRERNLSLMTLITWMGFRQEHVTYVKQARLHGASNWSLKKKLKLAVDSVTSFTYLPIRAMTYLGVLVAFCGFAYAIFVIFNALQHRLIQGWASIMVVVLVLGGAQMIMLGVLGEYLWRAFDEARQRPRYVIEKVCETRIYDVEKQTSHRGGRRLDR